MTSLTDLKDYFAFKADDLGLSFAFGASERILNRQSGQLEYPVLWLEVPDISVFRDGGLKKRFRGAFVILDCRAADDYDGQDASLDAMWAKTEALLASIQQDSEDGAVEFDFDMSRCESQHKPKFSADDDWGWRTEFSIVGAACESPDCCD